MNESSQISLFPIDDVIAHQARNKLVSGKWNAEKVINPINSQQDEIDYKKISAESRRFLDAVLIFFFAGDSVVEHLILSFIPRITSKSRLSYEFQKLANEDIHDEVYSRLLLIFKTPEEIKKCSEEIQSYDFVKKKIDWCVKTLEENFDFAMICMEGIFFSSSFCSIYWFKEQGLFPCVAEANRYIARDEGFHTDVGIYFLKNKPPEKIAHVLIREAVEIEKAFINEFCPTEKGMSPKLLCEHVESIADNLLISMKYTPFYNIQSPFPFMGKFGTEVKFDFFGLKPDEYQAFVKEPFKRKDF